MDKILKLFESIESEYNIFLDMDGVLVDFSTQFFEYLQAYAEENPDKVDVDLIKSAKTPQDIEDRFGRDIFNDVMEFGKVKFWETMDWMSDGQELYNYVKQYNPKILSAPSRNSRDACKGKQLWLKSNIPTLQNHNYQTKCKNGWDGVSWVLLNSMKYRYVTSDKDILIDDKLKNIELWRNAGGIGILHTDTESTIEELKKLGL